MKPIMASLPLLALACCNRAIHMPNGAVILPNSSAQQVLDQCSRWAPPKGEDTWVPSAADIDVMEAKIAAELPKQPEFSGLEQKPRFPQAFTRQYVGIVRHGHKFIYGNYAPKSGWGREDITKPIVICDGGPTLFGVEYDPTAKQFTEWGFNGVG